MTVWYNGFMYQRHVGLLKSTVLRAQNLKHTVHYFPPRGFNTHGLPNKFLQLRKKLQDCNIDRRFPGIGDL